MKRRYNSTGATFEESRRVRLKQNGPSTLGKNDKCTTGNASCSASKLMFQEDIEAASSASMGFHPVNSSKSYKRSFNLESSIPRKARSPACQQKSSPKQSTDSQIIEWATTAEQSSADGTGARRRPHSGEEAGRKAEERAEVR